MATATQQPRAINDEIRFEYGVPEVFALKFVTGKEVPSRYPGGRVMFSADDNRKLFLDGEDGSDLERALSEQQIEPGDLVRVTKIKHARGGGHSLRVERVSDAAEPTHLSGAGRARYAPDSESQVQGKNNQPHNYSAPLPERAPTRPALAAPAPEPPAAITPVSAKILAAYMVAVDTLIETREYAQRRGLALEVRCEDVRCLAATIMIDQQKGGR